MIVLWLLGGGRLKWTKCIKIAIGAGLADRAWRADPYGWVSPQGIVPKRAGRACSLGPAQTLAWVVPGGLGREETSRPGSFGISTSVSASTLLTGSP